MQNLAKPKILYLSLSFLFGFLAKCRRKLYQHGILRSTRVPIPLIAVGNVIAGGAGKTPTSIAILQYLSAQGFYPGLVSRGYGRQSRACLEVQFDSLAIDAGDEALLIKSKCAIPVFVAAKRVKAAQAMLQKYPDVNVIVSDDGLQHYAMARDIEIVVFDERAVGNGKLLPAGILREFWPRDRVFPNAVELIICADKLLANQEFINQTKRPFFSKRSLQASSLVKEQQTDQACVCAVAGIAQPDIFFSQLRAAGVHLEKALALADHDDFAQGGVFAKWLEAVPNSSLFACTEKDSHKIAQHFPELIRSHRLRPIALHLEIEEDFYTALTAAILSA